MINNADGVINSPVRTPPKTTTKVRKKGRVNIRHRARVFNRSAHKVHASRVTKPGVRTIEGKDLSSRKIVWLEKMKHRWNIFACSFRLVFHIYLDNKGRADLKDSREASKTELNILNQKEVRQHNVSKLHEELFDGQYKEAARRAKNAGVAAIKEGRSRFLQWARV